MAYHFTDLVTFISSDQLVAFDPHCRALPEGAPGLRTNFVEGAFGARFPDQMQPFLIPEITGVGQLGAMLPGTLFRLSMRTAEQAALTQTLTPMRTAEQAALTLTLTPTSLEKLTNQSQP